MNPEDIMPTERSQSQKDCMILLHEAFGVVKTIETERRMVVARG